MDMDHSSLLAEPVDSNVSRRETIVAGVFTILGLVAIVAARGGIESMIAGSVGSVGAACLAVGLTFLDGRLSYFQRAQASFPIVVMLAGVGLAIKANALALAGYPLLLLGLAGLIPALLQWHKAKPAVEPVSEKNPQGHIETSPA